jgi:uncharacterized protein (TIGR03435 family)
MTLERRLMVFFFAAMGLLSMGLAAQVTVTRRPAFDVVSVKPDNAGGPPRQTGTDGNRFIAENVPLMLLIQYAYRGAAGALLREQVLGAPSWLSTERFDIEAKVEGKVKSIPTQQNWQMVQSLLEDRFKLRVHRETRESPVYNLVVAKGGVKMKVSADQTIPLHDDDAEVPRQSGATLPLLRGEVVTTPRPSGETVIVGMAIPVSPNLLSRRPHGLPPNSLITVLWSYSGRPVVDKTGLKGLYDYRLLFVPSTLIANPDTAGNNPAGPPLFSAVEDQLGLKLESAKGPIEVLVIDSVQRPSAN